MGKAKEENSDDIEIISIGKLYTGPWDKKYWSSSRGKDRYPYPLGYKSVRTQNGVTYKMEILEGLKGPSFTINSSDGKSCSGETPDIAWDSFQKKGCSRIKLWHGKRFSCKIDGVQFFGFKNAFVQRLLRELVSNDGGNAELSCLEQNLLPSNISCGEAVNKLKDEEPSPHLIPYSGKARITGKRSRNSHMVTTIQQTYPKQHQHENSTENNSASNSPERDKSHDGGNGDLLVSAATNTVSGFCSSGVLDQGNLASTMEHDDGLTVAGRGMQLDSGYPSHHRKVESPLSQEQREFIRSSHPIELEADDGHRNPSNDGSRTIEVLGSLLEEKDVVTNVQHGMRMINGADLCVPDTLDDVVDNHCVTSKMHLESPLNVKDTITNDVLNSVISMMDSHPQDGMNQATSNTFSENCDTGIVGLEIAKSMMTVLLPRALPLLKTFSRKKKKNAKPSKTSNPGSQKEVNISSSCIHDASLEGEPAEHSKLERQKEKAYVPCTGHDSVVSTLGTTESVVPDSFDSYDPQDLIPHTARADQMADGLDTQAQLPMSVIGEKSPLMSHHEIKEHDLSRHHETQTTSDSHDNPQRDTIIASEKEIIANSKRARREGHPMDKLPAASRMKYFPGSDSINSRSLADVGLPEKCEASSANKMPKDGDAAGFNNASSNLKNASSCSGLKETDGLKDGSSLNNQGPSISRKLDLLKLSACYILPMPILMVQLIVKENDIYFCVKCGHVEHKESILFSYKASKRGENIDCPSLIGHVRLSLQSSTNALGRDIVGGSSILQFTPDAQSLVVLSNIKTPYCREGKLDCLCSACTSDCLKKNTIKILQLNSGYVSLVTRLETTQDVCCFLVCEPNFLLAAEESGKLKLWVMNYGWSAEKEHWFLPALDCILPCLVELKRIPQSASLVVGHNGIGEFGLWDIEERSLLSRFSSPGMSVFRCIPVSIFRWQGKGEHNTEEHVNEILNASKLCFARKSENHVFSAENKDVAVWLLICTTSDPDSQHYHFQSSQKQAQRVECWRLALLVNNMVITGSAIDSGAAAITSLGHGIIGRSDGLVYPWELSTGVKLGNLQSFKGTGVSCVTNDPTNSDVLAIAAGAQLLVYLSS